MILRSQNVTGALSGRWFAAIGLIAALAGGQWSAPAFGQSIGLTALTTFGTGGFVSPGSFTWLPASGDNQRGLAYNPVTKNVVVVSRAGGNTIAILNGTNGTLSGTLNNSGYTGGALALNLPAVDDNGQIYVCNVTGGAGQDFKIYKYLSESSTAAPTVVFTVPNPTAGTGVWGFGNSFAVYGLDTSLQFAASGATTSSTNNSNFMVGKLDGSNFNTIYRAIPGTATANNDYRLGLTFVDQDTIIGLQGGPYRITDFVTSGSGQTTSGATVTGSTSSSFGGTVNYRVLDYIQLGGKPYVATVQSLTGNVQVYDISNPSSPLLAAQLDLMSSSNANANGTASIAWGNVTIQDGFWFSAPIYSLVTNNGITGMVFTVPEPSTWAMLAAGAVTCGGVACSRSRSRQRRRAG